MDYIKDWSVSNSRYPNQSITTTSILSIDFNIVFTYCVIYLLIGFIIFSTMLLLIHNIFIIKTSNLIHLDTYLSLYYFI